MACITTIDIQYDDNGIDSNTLSGNINLTFDDGNTNSVPFSYTSAFYLWNYQGLSNKINDLISSNGMCGSDITPDNTFTTSGYPILEVMPEGGWNNEDTNTITSKTTTSNNLLDGMTKSNEILKTSENEKVKQQKVQNSILVQHANLLSEQTKLMRDIANENIKQQQQLNKSMAIIASNLTKKTAIDSLSASSTMAKNKAVIDSVNFDLNGNPNNPDLKDSNGDNIIPAVSKAKAYAEKSIETKEMNETNFFDDLVDDVLDIFDGVADVVSDEDTNIFEDLIVPEFTQTLDKSKIDTNGKEN